MKNVLTCLFLSCLFLMGCQSDTLNSSNLEADRTRQPSMKLYDLEQICYPLGVQAKVYLSGMQHVSNYRVTAEDEGGTILQIRNGTNPELDEYLEVAMGHPGPSKDCSIFLPNETYTIRAYKVVGTELFPAQLSPHTFTTISSCICD